SLSQQSWCLYVTLDPNFHAKGASSQRGGHPPMRANMNNRLSNVVKLLALLLSCSPILSAQTRNHRNSTHEQRTAEHFESLRKSPPQQLAFLREMPKGGDLHSHLSGTIYAESYVQWAVDSGLCFNTTNFALALPPCNPGQQG